MIFARFGDKKQTRWQNKAEIVFSLGVSEIKCIIFKENNDNPYEINNNYIKLSIVLESFKCKNILDRYFGPVYTIPDCIGASRFSYRIRLLFTLRHSNPVRDMA